MQTRAEVVDTINELVEACGKVDTFDLAGMLFDAIPALEYAIGYMGGDL